MPGSPDWIRIRVTRISAEGTTECASEYDIPEALKHGWGTGNLRSDHLTTIPRIGDVASCPMFGASRCRPNWSRDGTFHSSTYAEVGFLK